MIIISEIVGSLKWRIIFLVLFCSFASLATKAQITDYSNFDIRDEASRLLSEYIQYASVTGNEKEAGLFFSQLCLERGLHIKTFTESVDSYNFAASLYPLDLNKPNIVLMHHIDVVGGGDTTGWIYPAFSGAIVQDTIWGRGAIDMKGSAIMYLLAVSSLVERAAQSDFPMNVTLLCVSEEEQFGTKGSKIVSEKFLSELNAKVMIGEGGIGVKEILTRSPERPVFFVSISDKRTLWLKLHLDYGFSGHGSVPPTEYANKIMINALNSLTLARPEVTFGPVTKGMFKALGKMEKGVKSCILRSPGFYKPLIVSQLKKDPLLYSTVTNTITITQITNQNNDINQIPQEISAILDCRLLPETTTEEFIRFLRKHIKNDDIQISVILESPKASPTIPDNYYDLLKESLVETYPGAGVVKILFPATSDNNYYRNKGVPVYGIAPIIMDEYLLKTIHNYNERVPAESLSIGTEFYIRFLEKLLLKQQ